MIATITSGMSGGSCWKGRSTGRWKAAPNRSAPGPAILSSRPPTLSTTSTCAVTGPPSGWRSRTRANGIATSGRPADDGSALPSSSSGVRLPRPRQLRLLARDELDQGRASVDGGGVAAGGGNGEGAFQRRPDRGRIGDPLGDDPQAFGDL